MKLLFILNIDFDYNKANYLLVSWEQKNNTFNKLEESQAGSKYLIN